MPVRLLSLAAVFTMFSVLPIRAHHSHGNYDLTTWTMMDGTVKEVHLLVPHSWIYLDVKDDKGQLTTWALEATGPSGLLKVGIKREDVKPGDLIKVRCHLLRDGSNGCLLGYVTPAQRRSGARSWRRERLGRRRRRWFCHQRSGRDSKVTSWPRVEVYAALSLRAA
jgi:hypothetical protein